MPARALRRRALPVALMLACLATGAAVRWAPAAEGARAVYRVRTERPVVALSFDDGPDPRWTPTALALLHHYDDRATFFLVGKRATAHPGLVRQELETGEVANHTYDHRDLRRLSPAAVRREIRRAAVAIERTGAPRPRYLRPPYGHGDVAVRIVAGDEGYRVVDWDLCLEHFVRSPATLRKGMRRMLASVRPGDVLLVHDGGPPDRSLSMRALPRLLRGLKERGYRVVDVSDLLRAGRPALWRWAPQAWLAASATPVTSSRAPRVTLPSTGPRTPAPA